MHQPRDEHGQFVSISTLFERERVEHAKDHEQERLIARETALRLEREVEQTAVRLERAVEETALRLEKGVATALAAVADTARIHSEAHSREHQAHERIHAVEKNQLDKAESNRIAEGDRIAQDLKEYKAQANEWRGSLRDQSGQFVSRELFDAAVTPLQDFRARAIGFGALLALISGAAGAVIMRAVGG